MMEWRKEPSTGVTSDSPLLVRMGPETKEPSALEVKLACSQSAAPSKEVVSEEFRIGKARHATSAIGAPSPRSSIASAAAAGMKAAPREEIGRDPSSSPSAGSCALDSKSRGCTVRGW